MSGAVTKPVNDIKRGDIMDDRDHELLTIGEAADVVRCPIATLRYWRHLGIGPCSFRVGRRVLYRRGDIETWIAAQREATRSDIA